VEPAIAGALWAQAIWKSGCRLHLCETGLSFEPVQPDERVRALGPGNNVVADKISKIHSKILSRKTTTLNHDETA